MFWDFAADFYGIFEDAVNGKVNRRLCINKKADGGTSLLIRLLSRLGADFKRQFTAESCRQFFPDAGFPAPEITVIRGRIPCAVAVLHGCQQTEQ